MGCFHSHKASYDPPIFQTRLVFDSDSKTGMVTESVAGYKDDAASLLESQTHRPKAPTGLCNNASDLVKICRNPVSSSSSSEKLPNWSWRAIKAFSMGKLEARKLKYPTAGTEAILMGILIEGNQFFSLYVLKVREETVKLLGKADMYFFSPEHPPLTEDAQRVLDWAVDQNIKSGSAGEITTSQLLLGIWAEAESPGHKILATLGFDNEKAKELKSLSSDPGSIDD